MEGLLVGAATGALKPVLEKLAALMGDECKRFKGVCREVQSLTDEFSAIHAFLLMMSEEENPDVQDKAWLKDVWELSYDMEDILNEFMLLVDDKTDFSDGYIGKFKNFFTKIKAHHRIAKAIKELKVQVKDVGDRNNRYRSNETIVNTGNASVDCRALAIFEDTSKLIGIDGPKDDLMKLLSREDICISSGPWEVLMVVAIVGSGGMGKTTLANQVYRELRNLYEFSCSACVSVTKS